MGDEGNFMSKLILKQDFPSSENSSKRCHEEPESSGSKAVCACETFLPDLYFKVHCFEKRRLCRMRLGLEACLMPLPFLLMVRKGPLILPMPCGGSAGGRVDVQTDTGDRVGRAG